MNGNIGIGTTNPGYKLDVNGPVNATSFKINGVDMSVTPAGVIFMWPTATPPSGWFECDGSAKSRTTYANLFGVIGTMYGAGDGSTTFNIPDYRGYFPRGWAHGQTTDPDRASRTDRGDGVTGDNVGTKQVDAFKSHHHQIRKMNDANTTGADFRYTPYGTEENTDNTGGNETRPININVMYIIKY